MWTGWSGRWTDLPLVVDRQSGYDDGVRYRVRRASMEWTLREMASYDLDGATYNGTRPALACHLTNGTETLPAMYVANLQLRSRERSSFEYADSIPSLRLYLNSPTAWRHNGKPVFVSYWSDRTDSPERMLAKLKELHDELSDFSFVPDISSLSKWKWRSKWNRGEYSEADAEEMRALVRSYLRVADGVYFGEYIGLQKLDGGESTVDFDYYRNVVIARLREVLSEPEFAGKGKILGLVAGLGHGNPTTFGNTVGQDGTRTLRASIDATLSANPDFIVFFEWNEFNENTCWQPTLYNSLVLQRLVRYYADTLRGKTPRPNPGDDLNVPPLALLDEAVQLLLGIDCDAFRCWLIGIWLFKESGPGAKAAVGYELYAAHLEAAAAKAIKIVGEKLVELIFRLGKSLLRVAELQPPVD